MDAENLACSDVPKLQNTKMEEEINIGNLPSVALVNRSELPDCSAVYFVSGGDGQVLYIGSAVRLRTRWAQHAQIASLPTESVIAWAEVAENRLRVIEAIMVQRLSPTLNKLQPCADLRAGLQRESEINFDVQQYKCKRCKYEWVPRTPKVPRQCPRCWTTRWAKGKSK